MNMVIFQPAMLPEGIRVSLIGIHIFDAHGTGQKRQTSTLSVCLRRFENFKV